MNIFFAILSLICVSVLEGSDEVPYLAREYDASKWPNATLELSTPGTLKDLFDAGLRPYRHPGMESTLLELKHLNLTLILSNNKRLPVFPMEWMNVSVFTDGELCTLEASTPHLTLERARNEMVKWLPFSENDRTQDDLDKYLLAVEANHLDFDDPYRGVPDGCSIKWNEPGFMTRGGGPTVATWFRKTTGRTTPLQLYFKATWSSNRPQKDRSTYRPDAIPPPAGYEDVSMEAPQNFGPDSMVDILRAKGVEIGESPEAQRNWKKDWELGESARSRASNSASTENLLDSKTKPVSEPAAAPSNRKSWLVAILIAGLGSVFWFALKRRL
jgi:hypothetical protein